MQRPDLRVERSLIPVIARWAEQDKELLLPLFRLIASGEPIKGTRFSGDSKTGAGVDGTVLDRSLANIDSQGRVAELFGITRETTLHRITFGGETLFSCCALVAHTVPAIMQQAAVIESTDPVSHKTITLEISADSRLQRVDPLTACGSLVDCDLDEVSSSPRTTFCCHVKHFVTADTARAFSGTRPDLYVISIEDFHKAAQWLYEQVWAS